MLTATYTLVALSVAQAGLRVAVRALQEQLHAQLWTAVHNHEAPGAAQMAQACAALQRVHDNGHWRQIDLFVAPAIRRVTFEADHLLRELDQLRGVAADAIASLARSAALGPGAAAASAGAGIDAFCGAVLARLEREERELFPVARSVIPVEAWFSIANQMLVHDAIRQENKTARRDPDSALRERRAAARAADPLALSA